MRAALLVLVLALTVVSCSGQPSWSMCPGAPTKMNPSSVTVTVAKPYISINMTAALDEKVTSGTIPISVYFSGIKIYSESLDLSTGMTLPAGPGTVQFAETVNISAAPPGNYALDMQFNDQSGTELTCIHIVFSV